MVSALSTPCWRFALAVCLLLGGGLHVAQAQLFPDGIEAFQRKGTGNSADKVAIEAQFTPPTDDRPALLFVTADIAKGWHISALDQAAGGPMPTEIVVDPNSSARLSGPWQSAELPKTHLDEEIWVGLELREHSGEATWFAPLELTPGVDPTSLTISGQIEGQVCEKVCIPFEHKFTARLGDGVPLPANTSFVQQPAVTATPTPSEKDSPTTSIAPGMFASQPAAANVYDLSRVKLQASEDQPLFYYLITALLGGLILNVMPCVLPVIGLKVMSFVQQAGQSRAHAWALNCWYSAGIVAVFLVLATLAVTLQLGWGGQFGSAGFNITLIAIVFAMALSLLGLWEIPIPGFVGSSTAVELAEREGPTAAFLKGILTTLLATPCIGPFMTAALAWSVRQPAWMTYSVFGTLGLGMASPYLLIGAFPRLIRFLPRPGAWMETFKKVMGLVLLATVVWLLTFIESPLVVPTVAMMVVIAAACWWVSQIPVTSTSVEKFQSWAIASLVLAIGVMGSFGWLYKSVMLPRFEKHVAAFAEQRIGEDRLRIARDLGGIQSDAQLRETVAELALDAQIDDRSWQRFSLAKLGHLTLVEGKTVLVDFTADWCVNCKVLEKAVLKTQTVEEALTQANVVTMEADYTKRPETIDRTIKALGGAGVPLIAIFPANDPYRPIVFSDGNYTKSGLIDAIAQATGQREVLKASDTTQGAALR